MAFNESLLVQLGPEVRNRLGQGPKKLHDAVLKREELLQDQIRHFISLRVTELRNYAQHLLDEHTDEERRRQQDRKDAAAARNRPPLKSIVKRRASSTSKRVSFSNVPPRVEYYTSSAEDSSEPDSQVLESSDEGGFSPPRSTPRAASTSSSCSAVVVYEPSPDKPQLRAGQDFEVRVRRIPEQPLPSKPRTAGGYDFSKIDPRDAEQDAAEDPQHWHSDNSDEAFDNQSPEPAADHTLDKPAMPVFPNRRRRGRYIWHPSPQPPNGTVLTFEDAIDSGTLEAEAADEYPPSQLSSSSSSSSSSSTEREPMHSREYVTPPPATLTVGSAPIDIHTPLSRAMDGDGGPEGSRKQYESTLSAAAEELEVTTPPTGSQSDPYLPPAELDPANLSFSQRMEWEDRFHAGRHHGRVHP